MSFVNIVDGSVLTIHSTASHSTADHDEHTPEGSDIAQESKPRTAVIAEVLSHGYILGDQAIQKAIELDNSYGVRLSQLASEDADKDTRSLLAS